VRRCRGQGLGRAITEEYLRSGFAVGFRRFRLDVSADNGHAVEIYRSLGFVVEAEREAAGMRYLAMTLDDP
jgi:ribosomal protein S18 acetylase RimI-like enzyme